MASSVPSGGTALKENRLGFRAFIEKEAGRLAYILVRRDLPDGQSILPQNMKNPLIVIPGRNQAFRLSAAGSPNFASSAPAVLRIWLKIPKKTLLSLDSRPRRINNT